MIEVMRIAFRPILGLKEEPSLTISGILGKLKPVDTYIDDIFCKYEDFPTQWQFIKDHLLPRILWSLMKLSFSKVALSMDEIMAVSWCYRIGGRMSIKAARAAKLREWPVPIGQIAVRSFIGAVGPCRRWIANCAELARPLNRLTGDVPWQWGSAEALSFTVLRDKAATALEMHRYIFNVPI